MKRPEQTIAQYRYFLKDTVRRTVDFARCDQNRGIPPPPVQKPFPPEAERIELPEWRGKIGEVDLKQAIGARASRRSYRPVPLSLEELSFLLWATQGIRRRLGPGQALRTVPSAGARHALETYLGVMGIEGLKRGLYRYLPLGHQLLLEFSEEEIGEMLAAAAFGQDFLARAAVTFVWTAIPYRMEWRYGLAAHKVILLDAGHVCQNLYLACEAIGAGTCAVAAYDQEAVDRVLGVDGEDELAIYLAPVGKVGEGSFR